MAPGGTNICIYTVYARSRPIPDKLSTNALHMRLLLPPLQHSAFPADALLRTIAANINPKKHPRKMTDSQICTEKMRLLIVVGFAFIAKTAEAQTDTFQLGTARSYGILAASAITSTGKSVVNGHLGNYPGTAVTGFPPGGKQLDRTPSSWLLGNNCPFKSHCIT
jgi:hypothetical protein